MRAGALRHLVILERRVDDQATGGEVGFTYVEFDRDMAEITDLVGREMTGDAQLIAQGTTRIRMRYRADVDETCRIRHVIDYDSPMTEDLYDIAAPPMVDMKTGRQELIIMATKTRGDGWRHGPA